MVETKKKRGRPKGSVNKKTKAAVEPEAKAKPAKAMAKPKVKPSVKSKATPKVKAKLKDKLAKAWAPKKERPVIKDRDIFQVAWHLPDLLVISSVFILISGIFTAAMCFADGQTLSLPWGAWTLIVLVLIGLVEVSSNWIVKNVAKGMDPTRERLNKLTWGDALLMKIAVLVVAVPGLVLLIGLGLAVLGLILLVLLVALKYYVIVLLVLGGLTIGGGAIWGFIECNKNSFNKIIEEETRKK